MFDNNFKMPRMMRLSEVSAIVGLSRSQIYSLINQGKFPAQVKLSVRASAWREDEIRDWINNLIRPHD